VGNSRRSARESHTLWSVKSRAAGEYPGPYRRVWSGLAAVRHADISCRQPELPVVSVSRVQMSAAAPDSAAPSGWCRRCCPTALYSSGPVIRRCGTARRVVVPSLSHQGAAVSTAIQRRPRARTRRLRRVDVRSAASAISALMWNAAVPAASSQSIPRANGPPGVRAAVESEVGRALLASGRTVCRQRSTSRPQTAACRCQHRQDERLGIQKVCPSYPGRQSFAAIGWHSAGARHKMWNRPNRTGLLDSGSPSTSTSAPAQICRGTALLASSPPSRSSVLSPEPTPPRRAAQAEHWPDQPSRCT